MQMAYFTGRNSKKWSSRVEGNVYLTINANNMFPKTMEQLALTIAAYGQPAPLVYQQVESACL